MRYYAIPGEDAAHTIDFLEWAWMPKSETGLIPEGIPKILLVDKGPGNTSAMMNNLCSSFDIRLIPHATHRPWAKGQVEVTHSIVEREFEFTLRFDKVHNIDDLNRLATDWMIKFQSERLHTRYRQPRFAFYAEHAKPEFMIVPESAKMIRDAATSQPAERKVANNGLISFTVSAKSDVRLYQCPNEFKSAWGSKRKVKVLKVPRYLQEYDAVVVEWEGERRLAHPVYTDEAGFRIDARSVTSSKRAADDAPEAMRKRADELGPLEVPIQAMTPNERKEAADQYRLPAPSIRQAHQVAEVKYDKLDALQRVFRRLPGIEFKTKSEIRAAMTEETYTAAQIDRIVNEYRQTGT